MKNLISIMVAFLVVFTLSANASLKSSFGANKTGTFFDEIKTFQKQPVPLNNASIQKIKNSQASYWENLINQPELAKNTDRESELPLDSVIIEKIDSFGILQLNTKKIMFYDKNGYDSLTLIYQRDLLEKKWIIDQQEVYSFDNSGNKLLEILNQWNTSAGKWDGVYKYEMNYDPEGNETLNSSYHWDLAKENWAGDSKSTYEYNSDKDQTLKCNFEWDTLTNDWIGNSKAEITYFAPREQLTRTISRWDNTNKQWSPDSKTELSYNEDTLITVALGSEFDLSSQQWVNSWKEEMTYDSLGYEKSLKSYAWDKEWIIQQSNEYTYDSKGNQTLYINSHWDYEKQELVYNTKVVSEFDENGITTFNANYTWDSDSSGWICTSKSVASYNTNTGIIEYISYEKNESDSLIATGKYETKLDSLNRMTMIAMYLADSTGAFSPFMKQDIGYDIYGNVNFNTLYATDETTGEFTLLYQVDVVYDANGEELSMIAQKRDETTGVTHPYTKRELIWENPLKEIFLNYIWDSELNKLVVNLKNTYYYSDDNSQETTARFAKNGISMYPNPASDILNVDLKDASPAQIEIYNLHGTKVVSQNLSTTKQISVNQLNKGMYIYHILQNGKTYQGKIMVK
ncbi:MAG TPA: T9SS type A sorting domain-containing protein [Prolixibacteraceae bacterium]|nr:T9SS type A sorting domain-containing protein [Prolixibacteraceae bacterium]